MIVVQYGGEETLISSATELMTELKSEQGTV